MHLQAGIKWLEWQPDCIIKPHSSIPWLNISSGGHLSMSGADVGGVIDQTLPCIHLWVNVDKVLHFYTFPKAGWCFCVVISNTLLYHFANPTSPTTPTYSDTLTPNSHHQHSLRIPKQITILKPEK